MLCYKCFGNGRMFFKRVVYLECRVWKRQLYCSVRNLSKLSQHCSSNVSYISNSYNFCGDAVIYYSHLLRAWLCHKAASCKKNSARKMAASFVKNLIRQTEGDRRHCWRKGCVTGESCSHLLLNVLGGGSKVK